MADSGGGATLARGGWRRDEHGWGRGFEFLWALAAVVFALGVLFGQTTADPGELPRVWLPSATATSWLMLSWRGVVPQLSRTLLLTAASIFVITALSGLDADVSVPAALWGATGILLQAVLMCAGYRWARVLMHSPLRRPIPGAARWRREIAVEWAPTGARDLVALLVTAALSALVVVPLFGVPSLWSGDPSGQDVLDWVIRVAVPTFVSVTSLLAFATWTRATTSRRALLLPLIGVASVLALIVLLESGAVPLVWVVLLPSLYVASTFPLWATSAYSLGLGFTGLVIHRYVDLNLDFDPVIPVGYVVDLLVSVCVFVALTIALIEEHRAQLVSDVEAARVRATRQSGLLSRVFESMADGFVVVGPALEIGVHNKASVDLLGRPFPETPPESWVDYFGITRPDGSAVRDEDLIHADFLAVQPEDGSRRVLHQRVVPLTDDPQDGLVVSFADVTRQHERLRELSSFAGVVAHDLRAPLSSIEGWLELVSDALEHGHPDEAVALLMRARAANQRMREIIEDWLHHTVDLEGALYTTDFPLANPASVVVSTHVGTGEHRFALDVPHQVHADLAMVRQLLDNLVGNACKYARPGEAAQVAITSTRVSPGWILVEIADHGIGLPPGEEERIFEKYHRADEHARNFEGSGVGLALCREIVERRGGEIRARVNEHGGTTVSFTLPEAAGPQVEKPA